MAAMPPPTNIIQNGTFDLQGMFWTGVDIETTFFESSYFGTNNTNRVAEIDGNAGQTTQMRQSFNIAGPLQTELTFIAALRSQNTTIGQDGFTVDIVNSSGTVIASLTVLPPVRGVYETYTLPVNFTTAGTYTLRFTELGPDNSFGAIVDNISILVCFAGQTLIDTPTGATPARAIKPGDLVTTEHGPMPVRWVGRRHVTADEMASNAKLRPVKITAGALGQGLPRADLWVSRQHRMLVSSPICQRMFGQTDILVSALKLTALPGIHIDAEIAQIDYIHLLFDQHEVLFAEGAPSESLLLHSEALNALSPEAVEEIRLLFPEVTEGPRHDVRLIPKGHQQTRLADRMAHNARLPLETFRRPA
jgi:hypothetical protein